MHDDETVGTALQCPSAQPDMVGARVFGVVGGSADQPRVGYLMEPQPVTPDLLALSGPVEPTEIFRFSAPCAESACSHFDGTDCGLASKIVQLVPAVVEKLPACRLRRQCRWWRQEGGAACRRCPLVVTSNFAASPALHRAADPSVAPEHNAKPVP